jgi:hypothetical protein
MEHFNTYLRGRHFTVFSDHKPLETSGKKHDKTLSRIQEAFMQWDFEIKYKKGIEMPADYLSRNVVEAIDMSNEDLAEMQNQDKFCVSLKHLLNKLPVEKEYSKLVPQMTKLSHSCFIENGVLWKRITRHHGQHTVVVVLKTLTEKLLTEVHGNVLYGHEGQYKTKERLIQLYWWPGMDGQINKHLKECDKSQRTKKDKRPTTNFSSPICLLSKTTQKP